MVGKRYLTPRFGRNNDAFGKRGVITVHKTTECAEFADSTDGGWTVPLRNERYLVDKNAFNAGLEN